MSGEDLLVVVAASLLGSFVKSVTGMGYPLIAIPILSLFVNVEDAVVVIAVPNTVANLLLNVHARHAAAETRDLPILAIASVLGALAGTVLLVTVPEEPLLVVLAATIVAHVVQYVRRPDFVLDPATSRRWAPVSGTTAGVMQGAIGVSGPIVAMWFQGYRLGKDAFVFSVTLVFLVSGTTQAVVLAAGGRYDHDRLIAVGLALAATLSMIPLGTRVRDRLDTVTFERAVVILLVAAAVSLVVRSFG